MARQKEVTSVRWERGDFCRGRGLTSGRRCRQDVQRPEGRGGGASWCGYGPLGVAVEVDAIGEGDGRDVTLGASSSSSAVAPCSATFPHEGLNMEQGGL